MKDDTVEVLVRIPKHDYDYILGQGDTRGTPHLAEAICNGIVLPKGHGRLIDENDVISKINLNYNNHQLIDAQSIKDIVRTVATTIGTDTER